MELNEGPQQEQGEQQEQEQPQQPSIDPRVALEIAAQQFGVSPDYLEGAIRLQDENRRVAEENRRRAREIEMRETQLEAEQRQLKRFLPQEPQYEVDPVVKPLYNEVAALKQMFLEERQERVRMAEQSRVVERTARDLQQNYMAVMRGVPTQNQVDETRFFAAMAEIYPTSNGQLPEGITPEKAVFNTAKYLGLNVNGSSASYGPPRPMLPRDPRAQFVVPSQSVGPSTPAQAMQDAATQRAGETPEQYFARRIQAMKDAGFNAPILPEGTKVSFG